jgi:chromosome segregation ATPase
MNPPPEPADLVLRLRQQLILAQVRIMELEDARDELQQQLAAAEKTLRSAQELAEAKLGESTHQAKVLDELRAHCDHLRHVQHVTHTALEQTRGELTAAQASAARLGDALAVSTARGDDLARETVRLGTSLGELEALATARADRIAALDRELAALKRSRSWRWTSWLRGIERWLNRTA